MTLVRRAIVMATLLSACGGSEATPPPSASAAPGPSIAAPPASAPPTTVAPSPSTTPPASSPVSPPTLDAAARARVRDAVRAGRAAVHEGRAADALAPFREAIAIDTGNRRLRCEAGFVAHLAGDESAAESLIDQALAGMPDVEAVPETMRVAYAQCLYNAGLVYQATDRGARAREVWERSIALRPNATVQQHLDALAAGTAPEATPLPALDATGDVDALRRAVVDRALRAAAIEDGGDGSELPPFDIESVRTTVIGEGAPHAGIEAYLFVIDPTIQRADTVLVVRTAGRAAAFVALEVFNPGALGIWADGTVRTSRFVDLVPGGAPELVLEVDESNVDMDLGGCVEYGSTTTSQIVCSVEGGIACARLPVSSTSSEHCDPECITEWDERCGHDRPRAGDHDTDAFRVHTTWSNGQATLAVDGHGGQVPRELAGTYDFPALLRRVPLTPL